MKFLVLGAGGMAGHTISIYLQEQGHYVLGFDRIKVSHCESVIGDAKNLTVVKEIITNGKFDTVVNAIGILNQFADQNKETAVFLNAYFPHFLAYVTKNTVMQVAHISTDCVFSGKRGNYTETDLRDGETFYDRTKALGELEDNKNITMRNSIVGPDMDENGIGLFNWFMKQHGLIKGFTKTMWTGLTTLQLAKAIEYAAKIKASGLYNMVYKESISKYHLLMLFNKYMKNNKLTIEADDTFIVNKSLKRTRFEFDYIVPDYEKMIFDMAEWIKAHKHFYPHYNL
jgi:dTDP-4-dehydrorhamnose reductase